MAEQTAEITMKNDDTVAVTKNGKELITFERDDNLGDTYYNIISLLEKLDIQVEEV